MKIKISLLLIWFLISGNMKLNAQENIIKKEAKYYCKCYQSFNKKKKRLERKAKREEKKSKKYTPGMKLFGGDSLDFSFENCLNNKRKPSEKKYIASLNDKEKEIFRKKVKKRIKKKYSKCNSEYY